MVRGGMEGQRGGGLVGLSVEGWRLSVMWSRSPEKRNKQQEARTGQTLLNYRAETQQRGTKRRQKNDNKDQETGLMATTRQTSSTPD